MWTAAMFSCEMMKKRNGEEGENDMHNLRFTPF